jgi:hypothetical protein
MGIGEVLSLVASTLNQGTGNAFCANLVFPLAETKLSIHGHLEEYDLYRHLLGT